MPEADGPQDRRSRRGPEGEGEGDPRGLSRLLIVAAAGIGSRLGRDEPKALVSVAGRPLLAWTLEALDPVGFARTVVAAPPGGADAVRSLLAGRGEVVEGGRTRSESVRRAFEALAASPFDFVCVHDGARPLVSDAETRAVLAAAEESGAAIAAIPVVDTIKRVNGRRIIETLDRRSLFAAATPQVFRARDLARAVASAGEATDEAALLEAAGIPVTVVPVSRLCFKITSPEDLEMAEAILRRRSR